MSLSMSGVTEAQTPIPPTRIVSRVTGKLEIIADGGICRATGRTKLARYSPTDHPLRFGLDAPPTASQAFVLGVAIETQLCTNDANVSGRTAAPTYST
jgi:hypothetical protein